MGDKSASGAKVLQPNRLTQDWKVSMIKTVFRLIPLAAAISLATTALADSNQSQAPVDVYNLSLAELGQVQISIATGNSTSLDKAPATASVIYAAEIEAMGARNLDDVLEGVPGLHVSLSSLSRLDSIYSIRGIHTGFNPQVLLLLNGIPVQSSLQGTRPTLFRLPVACIERVEVIRGPGSAVYGADAYAGVINVITKDFATSFTGVKTGARAGSFNTRDIWLQSGTEWNSIGIAFDMAYQTTDGDHSRRVNSDLQTTLDNVLGTHASLAPGALSTRYDILDTHLALTGDSFQANLWNWHSRDAGVGAGGAQAIDPVGHDDSDLLRADLIYHLSRSAHWDNSLRASYMRYDILTHFQLLPPGTLLPIGSDGNLDFAHPAGVVLFPDGLHGNPGGVMGDGQFEAVSIFTGWDAHRLRMAAGFRRQDIDPEETKNFGPGVIDGTVPVVSGALTDLANTSNIYLADSHRNLHYLSLQDEWQLLNDLQLTTGLRYDDYSDFGSTTNPRIALVWSADENLTTKLLYGSAFRAPSFSDLYLKNNPVSLGNPHLHPEQIDTVELSFNYRTNENLQTTLTLFDYRAEDMIEFIADPNATTKTAQNARNQDGKGFEFEVNWKPSQQLHFSASYSRQVAEDADSGAPVPDAPGQQIKCNLNWLFASDWSLSSQLYWIGDRKRSQGDTRPAVDNYALANVNLNKKNILPDLDLSLAVRNLANKDAREPSSGTISDDYPLESRSYWLGITYSFK